VKPEYGRFWNWLFGGRPMVRLDTNRGFVDSVANKTVYFWVDGYGREWMAFHRWSGFRVRHEQERGRI